MVLEPLKELEKLRKENEELTKELEGLKYLIRVANRAKSIGDLYDYLFERTPCADLFVG